MRKLAALVGLLVVVGMVTSAYCQVPVETTVKGTIDKVDAVKGEVSVITKEATDTEPAVTEVLVVEAATMITLVDGKAGELADLKKGDKVEAKGLNGKVTEIKVGE